jgi:hypothetical protein
MPLNSTYILIISIFVSVATCFGQYQKMEDLNYLVEHATFFDNGIITYQENGKYGFKYKNHRLSEPIYDTIYNFSRDFCVVKQDSVLSLLDHNLRNSYLQPIRSIEKYYSEEKKTMNLKITSVKGHSNEYSISQSNSWGIIYSTSNSVTYPMHQNIYSRSITDSIDLADRFPGTGDVNILINERIAPQSPYSEILIRANSVKLFPKNGIPFIRERAGLQVMDYLGASLIAYRNRDTYQEVIIDEATEDTILTADFKISSFSADGKLYLYQMKYAQYETIDKLEIYNDQGKLIQVFIPGTSKGRKNKISLTDDGMILERIQHVNDAEPRYNIYSARSLKCILKNVSYSYYSKNYVLYYSNKDHRYFVLKGERIIYSLKASKEKRLRLYTIDDRLTMEKEPIYIQVSFKDQQFLESIIRKSLASHKEKYLFFGTKP